MKRFVYLKIAVILLCTPAGYTQTVSQSVPNPAETVITKGDLKTYRNIRYGARPDYRA
ncbi:MAG: hypothetical protein AB2L24_15520 [Mangrovibacterium sp.]